MTSKRKRGTLQVRCKCEKQVVYFVIVKIDQFRSSRLLLDCQMDPSYDIKNNIGPLHIGITVDEGRGATRRKRIGKAQRICSQKIWQIVLLCRQTPVLVQGIFVVFYAIAPDRLRRPRTRQDQD